VKEAIARILGRRQAYRRVFNLDDRDVMTVLADLRRFCGDTKPLARVSPISASVDPNATLVAVGRFEVWQRIREFLTITDADLLKLQERQEDHT
jgi:hypothetical protein